MNRIYYTKPSITELEVRYATDAAANGWGENCYAYIARFEALFSEHLKVAHSIATSSCTGALHMGLSAAGVQPGDEVILADVNWIASAAPIVHLGARPVFVDILPDTWCIDPAKIERAITPRTKAIVAVHLYGNLCEMDQILAIARKHGLIVVEDAAEALGSEYHGRRAGTLGDFGVFSFHGTKTITTGEGGMFVTNRADLFDRVTTLSNHGRSPRTAKQFWAEMVGFKYKLSNIQAALGCAQMERLAELLAKKREIFHAYRRDLATIPGVAMNPEKPGTVNGYWMPTVVFDRKLGLERQVLLDRFRDNAIDGRVFFYPLSSLPMFQAQPANVVSYDIFSRAVNLPSYHDLSHDDIARVVRVTRECIGRSPE
jgi:perosamine synthetase